MDPSLSILTLSFLIAVSLSLLLRHRCCASLEQYNYTALVAAASEGHAKVVKLLLEAGFDTEARIRVHGIIPVLTGKLLRLLIEPATFQCFHLVDLCNISMLRGYLYFSFALFLSAVW